MQQGGNTMAGELKKHTPGAHLRGTPLPGEVDPYVVYVSNLAGDTDTTALGHAMQKFGAVSDVVVKRSSSTTWPQYETVSYYAFVRFNEPAAVNAAVAQGSLLFENREIFLRSRKGRRYSPQWVQDHRSDYSMDHSGKTHGNNGNSHSYKNDRIQENNNSSPKDNVADKEHVPPPKSCLVEVQREMSPSPANQKDPKAKELPMKEPRSKESPVEAQKSQPQTMEPPSKEPLAKESRKKETQKKEQQNKEQQKKEQQQKREHHAKDSQKKESQKKDSQKDSQKKETHKPQRKELKKESTTKESQQEPQKEPPKELQKEAPKEEQKESQAKKEHVVAKTEADSRADAMKATENNPIVEKGAPSHGNKMLPGQELAPLATSSLPPGSPTLVQGNVVDEPLGSEMSDARHSMVVKFVPSYYDKDSFDAQCTYECGVAAKSIYIFDDGPTKLAIVTAETRDQADKIFKHLNALRMDSDHSLRVVWLSEEAPVESSKQGKYGVEKPLQMPNYNVQSPFSAKVAGVGDGNAVRKEWSQSPPPPMLSNAPFSRVEVLPPAPVPMPSTPGAGISGPGGMFNNRHEGAHPYNLPQPGPLPSQQMYRTLSMSTSGPIPSPPSTLVPGGMHYPTFDQTFTAPNSRMPSPPVPMNIVPGGFNGPFGPPPAFPQKQSLWMGGSSVAAAGPSQPPLLTPLGLIERTVSPSGNIPFRNQGLPGMPLAPNGPPSPMMPPYMHHPLPRAIQPTGFRSPQGIAMSRTVSNSSMPPRGIGQSQGMMVQNQVLPNLAHDMGSSSYDKPKTPQPPQPPQLQPDISVSNNAQNIALAEQKKPLFPNNTEAATKTNTPPQVVPEEENPEDPALLYVKNLDDDEVANDDDLKKLFAPHGEIDSVELRVYENGRSMSFGFVKFKLAEDAKRVKDSLNAKIFGKKRIFISYAESKEHRQKRLQEHFSHLSPEKPKARIAVEGGPQAVADIPQPDFSISDSTDQTTLSSNVTIKVPNNGSVPPSGAPASDTRPSTNSTAEVALSGNAPQDDNKVSADEVDIKEDSIPSKVPAESPTPFRAENGAGNLNATANPMEMNSNLPLSTRDPGDYVAQAVIPPPPPPPPQMVPFANEGQTIFSDGSGTNLYCGDGAFNGQLQQPCALATHWDDSGTIHPGNRLCNNPYNVAGGSFFPINDNVSYPNKGRNNNYSHKGSFGRGNGNGHHFRPSRFPKEQKDGYRPQQGGYVAFNDTYSGMRGGASNFNRGTSSKHNNYNHNNRNDRHDHQISGKRQYSHPRNTDERGQPNTAGSGHRAPLADTPVASQPMAGSGKPTNRKKRGSVRDFGGHFDHLAQNAKKENTAHAW